MGKPLILYSIETAQACPSIDMVFVSTDDEEIAKTAVAAGAIVIDRPKHLASDTSPEWLSWKHAVEYVELNHSPFDVFISLPATSPLRAVEDVEAAINKLVASESDVCISITPAARSPYFNMVKINPNGDVQLVNQPNQQVSRRQDAPEVFDITTVVYAANKTFVENASSIFEGKVSGVVIPKDRAIDIDDIYDFMFAETLLKGRNHVA